MEFVSILDNKKRERIEERIPSFFVDLNLDQVIEQIQAQSQLPVRKLYYELPANQACENYRRAIYADVKKEVVYTMLWDCVSCMEGRRQANSKVGCFHISLRILPEERIAP